MSGSTMAGADCVPMPGKSSSERGSAGAERRRMGSERADCADRACAAREHTDYDHADHEDAEFHHHHSHAASSHHPGHHHLLTVEHVSVLFDGYDASAPFWQAGRVRSEVIHDLTLSVHAGEILAVVGASGSGKSVLADALLGLYEPNAEVRGRIWFDGEEQTAESLAALRGREVAFVPQSVTCLDPLMRVGAQVQGAPRGATRAERTADRQRRAALQRELFSQYGLDESAARMYPHQLSGGMARRVLLMCALMERPKLIIADEPTPGLDLDLAVRAVDDLRAFANTGGGVLLITHDLELALRVADRVAVFKDGAIVEETSVEAFMGDIRAEGAYAAGDAGECSTGGDAAGSAEGSIAGSAAGLRHPLSRALARSVPERLPSLSCPDAAGEDRVVLRACDLSFTYPCGKRLFERFSLELRAGERVALEAPSGAGKTTLCRLMAGYMPLQAGSVEVDGASLDTWKARGEALPVQLIAQHPEHAFDPRMRLGRSLQEAGDLADPYAQMLLERFGVRDAWLARLPHELSGGELMRFCLVRALLARPRVLLCDESTAMLDLVTQVELWRVITELQAQERFALVLVSHSPGLVRWLSTRRISLVA